MTLNTEMEITEQEAELYDRQIRLWGLDSQKRYVFFITFKYQILTFYCI